MLGGETQYVAMLAHDEAAGLQRLIVAAAHSTRQAVQSHVKVVLAAPVSGRGQLASRLAAAGTACAMLPLQA